MAGLRGNIATGPEHRFKYNKHATQHANNLHGNDISHSIYGKIGAEMLQEGIHRYSFRLHACSMLKMSDMTHGSITKGFATLTRITSFGDSAASQGRQNASSPCQHYYMLEWV